MLPLARRSGDSWNSTVDARKFLRSGSSTHSRTPRRNARTPLDPLRACDLRRQEVSDELSLTKRYLNMCKQQQQLVVERRQEVHRHAAMRKISEKRKVARRQREEAAARRLQSFFRSYFTRKAIRSAMKTWQQREEVTEYLKQGLRVELWKLKQQCHDLEFNEEEKRSAAVVVQSFWRGILARRLVTVLQASRLVEHTRSGVHKCATLINAAARGRLGRKVGKKLWAIQQEALRVAEEAAQREREIQAAQFIQRIYRGFAARRDTRRLREAKTAKSTRRRSALRIQVRRRSVEAPDDRGALHAPEEEAAAAIGKKPNGKDDRIRKAVKPGPRSRLRSGSGDHTGQLLEGTMTTHEAMKAFEYLYSSSALKIIAGDAKFYRRLDADPGILTPYTTTARNVVMMDEAVVGAGDLFVLPCDE